ncbi:hypothetical protein [Lunatibacter salilacus]|uniref:hypothetical protein n=1 Tax=Lunatibacter salilacus TaxID=2483804 RepID=UPI00131E5555|nr:hypothetical protein [Lunatibacter salilacus]
MNDTYVGIPANFMVLIFLLLVSCRQNTLGVFEEFQDIGNPALPGNTVYDSKTDSYTLTGSGYNIWFDRDEFYFLYKEVNGDFSLTADMELIGLGVDPHRKVGIMVRSSKAADAAHMTATVHGDGLTVMQWRREVGMEMRDPEDEIFAEDGDFQTIKLERKGNEYTMWAAKAGGDLQRIGSQILESIPEDALLGLFICSHNPDVLEQAIFSQVNLSKSNNVGI